jgi:hypothetical protein
MIIYNNFYVFLGEGEYTIVLPTVVGEEKGGRNPGVRQGRQCGAGARRRRDLGCVEGGSGEPGRDGGRRCWGETYLIRTIIDIFSTILYINLFFKRNLKILTQTINLLASVRPNLGVAGQDRCTSVAPGGGY